jgi:hypothetical protein
MTSYDDRLTSHCIDSFLESDTPVFHENVLLFDEVIGHVSINLSEVLRYGELIWKKWVRLEGLQSEILIGTTNFFFKLQHYN